MICKNSNEDTQAARRKRRPLFLFRRHKNAEAGSVLFYIFIAIGLLGALTLSFIDSSREGATAQSAEQMAITLYSQANAIRSDIVACMNKYPNSVDLDSDGDIDSNDNPNPPYPLAPSNVNNPNGAAADDYVSDLQCPGAPSGQAGIYASGGTSGQTAPSDISGFTKWRYKNLGTGQIFLKISSINNNTNEVIAMQKAYDRFSNCEADLDDAAKCGTDSCLIVYLKRTGC